MDKITFEDFENHWFKVDIERECEGGDEVALISKPGCYFRLIFDEDGQYVILYDEFNDVYFGRKGVIYADEVKDFGDLLSKLAERIERVAFVYEQRSMDMKNTYDKLIKEANEFERHEGTEK